MDEQIRFQVGDRVVERDEADPIRADVRAVSQDGTRIRVQFWSRLDTLQTMWTYAKSWRLV